MIPHGNLPFPPHSHHHGGHYNQQHQNGHLLGGLGRLPIQDSFRSDDPSIISSNSSSFVNYRQNEDGGDGMGDIMGEDIRNRQGGGGGVRHEKIEHKPMSEQEKSQKQDKYLEMMI